MVVLLTCNNEEDPIKNSGARVFTTLYINFSDAQGQILRRRRWYLVVIRTRPSFHVCPLVTCKNEEDLIKNASARVFTTFLPLKVYGVFSRRSRAAYSAVLGPFWPNFELVRDIMDVLVTCKYEEDPIKNEGARVVTTLYSNFSDAQGQITLVLVSVSGRNLNLSKLSCMSSLPARMRMTDLKMKELECSQDFSHYKSMWIFPDAQGQLTPQSLVRSGRISNSFEML